MIHVKGLHPWVQWGELTDVRKMSQWLSEFSPNSGGFIMSPHIDASWRGFLSVRFNQQLIVPQQEMTEAAGRDLLKRVHLELVWVVVGFVWTNVWSEAQEEGNTNGFSGIQMKWPSCVGATADSDQVEFLALLTIINGSLTCGKFHLPPTPLWAFTNDLASCFVLLNNLLPGSSLPHPHFDCFLITILPSELQDQVIPTKVVEK